MQTVTENFRKKVYSGEALYHTNLQINEQEVPIEQIASIEIDSPIIDETSESFYLGTFISQSVKIKFKNLDGLDIASNNDVYLEIGEERDSYNLLNTQNIEPSTISGLDINLDNTLLSLNGSNSAAGYIIPSNTNTGIVLNEGNYLLSVTILAGDVNFGSSNTVVYIKNYNTNATLGSASIKSAYNNTNKVQVSGTIVINEPTNIGFEIYTNGVVEYNGLKVGIQLQEGTEVKSYEQYGTVTEYIPIGRYLIDDLAEDYFTTCEINCLDYAIKLKPNIDYSPCFTVQNEGDTPTATIQTIFNYICEYFGIEVATDISTLPNINVTVGTYDGSISGKQWISYIAEIMGCNVKFDRYGRLILIPLKHEKAVTINALESEEFTLGEKYEISRVVYFDAVRNFTDGEDLYNTLYIRQDNPFVTDESVIQNINNTLFDYEEASVKSEYINIDNGNDDIPAKIELYGNTKQETTTGIQLYNYRDTSNVGADVTTDNDGWITSTYDNSQGTGNKFENYMTHNLNLNTSTKYVIFCEIKEVSGTGGLYITSVDSNDSGQFLQEPQLSFTDLKAGDIIRRVKTTKSSFVGDVGLRTFVREGAGQSGSITFRLSVYKNTSITVDDFVYEKYSGEYASPSPDYPQKVNNITDELTLNINNEEKKINFGKNMLDISDITTGNNITNNGDGTITLNGGVAATSWTLSRPIVLKAYTKYTLSLTNTYASAGNSTFILRNGSTNIISIKLTDNSTSYMPTEDKIIDTLRIYNNGINYNNYTFSVQLEQSDHATNYVPFFTNKNLVPALSTASGNGLLFKELVDGSTNITGYSTASTTKYLIQNLFLKAGTYTLSVQLTNIPPASSSQIILRYQNSSTRLITINLWQTLTGTVTLNEDTKVLVYFYSNAGVTFDTNIKVQLERGSTATKFEKYGVPIELCKLGDNQDYIRKSTGKNLFDGIIVTGRWNYTIGSEISPNTSSGYRNANAININSNTIYTMTGITNVSGGYIVETDEDDIVLSIDSGHGYKPIGNTANVPFVFTFTSHSQAKHLYWYIPSANATIPINIMVEKGSTASEYEPYGTVWYKYKKIEKYIFDGNESWQINDGQTLTNTLYFSSNKLDGLIKNNYYTNRFSNYFYAVGTLWDKDIEGLQLTSSSRNVRVRINKSSLSSEDVTGFTEWLSTHNTEVYYVLATPTVEIIYNENLITQLENTLNLTLLNGHNIITTTNEFKPELKLDYIAKNYFKIWSLETKNYGDVSLDAWDIIEYSLGEDEHGNPITYQTYNNNHINYEMNISSVVKTQIPTKQKEITTNIYDNDEEVRVKMIKTLLDYVNAEVILQAEEQREQSRRLTQLRLDLESIQNIFQITGGSNMITNSQFLFDDPEDNDTHLRTYWNFTNNGTNPYQNIGSGFDGSLAGQTTSVAKIQLRNIIASTSSSNIAGLKEGQTYTFNYAYKQDALTTTNFQLIDSNNNFVTYSILNEETGLYEDKEINFTYDSEETNYKYVTIQFTAPTNTLYLTITTTTTSGDTNSGYFYLYDLMLNSGDKKSWEPAKSEVYSTVLKMSQLGLQVMATGSNIATLINADGFRIFKLNGNNLGDEITSFNDKGLTTGIAETDEVHTGNYVLTEIQINNVEHHIEYFKERI